jgi:hypothetical protein
MTVDIKRMYEVKTKEKKVVVSEDDILNFLYTDRDIKRSVVGRLLGYNDGYFKLDTSLNYRKSEEKIFYLNITDINIIEKN